VFEVLRSGSTLAQFQVVAVKSGRGLPQSKTLTRGTRTTKNAERLGVLQPSGAFASDTQMCHFKLNRY
jgi:hypothetical protein